MPDTACPFCGNTSAGGIILTRGWEDQYGGSPTKPALWVECRACDARGPIASTEDAARTKWATRAERPVDNPETPARGE